MKKLIVTLTALVIGLSAQAQWLPGAGYIHTIDTYKNTSGSSNVNDHLNGFYLGASYNLAITNVLGLAPGAYLTFAGQSNAESQGIGQIISGTVASHYTEVAFNVPLHLTFQAPLGDEAKIFAYGGPAVQLGLMSRTTYHGSISIGGIHYSEGDAVNHYNSENGTLNRFKALVGGGLGAQFGDLTFVLGYDYCLTNFSKVDGYTARRSQIRAGIHFGF